MTDIATTEPVQPRLLYEIRAAIRKAADGSDLFVFQAYDADGDLMYGDTLTSIIPEGYTTMVPIEFGRHATLFAARIENDILPDVRADVSEDGIVDLDDGSKWLRGMSRTNPRVTRIPIKYVAPAVTGVAVEGN